MDDARTASVSDRLPGRARLVAWALLAAWTALLVLPALQPRGPLGGAGLAVLRSASELGGLALRAALWGALETLRVVPLGLLAVLALPDRPRRRERLAFVGLPALAAALACAVLARWAFTRASGAWSSLPAEAILALPGTAIGTAAGLAWRRGRRARLLFVPRLAAVAAALAALVAGAAWLALEREPRVPEPEPVASAEKVRLHQALSGKHPRKIPPGETRTLRLDEADVESLLAWAWSIQRQGRALIRLDAPGAASASVSVRVPHGGGRWLNAEVRFRLAVEDGELDLDVRALRLGRLPVPRPALLVAAPALLSALRTDPRVRGVLGAIRSLRLERGAVSCTYSRLELPRGQLPILVFGEEAAGGVRAVVDEQVERILAALEGAPPGDARFVAALRAAFGFAAGRSSGGSAVEENRAALLGLGIVLGHERLAWVTGSPLDGRRAARVRRARDGTTVRGRNDWVRHFAVSGALTALASEAPSDAAGLYKEERDAFGGSGFSFGDLLADRAGTAFAERATRGEAEAASLQARVAGGLAVEEIFPQAADLPEGIPDGELQARYGGVGGPLYRRWADEIERRIASLPGHGE